ncbi:MAG: C_GCAxxG_C_C family protein [Kiritimatiellae bacterium]|nr:C_GCAxxG_C_C family protein [Kiritimatiellia bacterium]
MNRGEKAAGLFLEGHNCSQSVFGAFAGEFGVDSVLARKLSSGLGGGVGRTREVCGAVTGGVLALGLKFGPEKNDVYPAVQRFCERFKSVAGSVVCRELLSGTGADCGGVAAERTAEYYRRRPCAELVRLAAEIVSEYVDEDGKVR